MNLEERLARSFLHDHPADAAHVLERLPVDRRSAVLRYLSSDAVPALGEMMPSAVADCVAQLGAADGASLLVSLPLDRGVGVLRRLTSDQAERTLVALPKETQDLFRRVLKYRAGTAGALMDPVVPELPADVIASEARLRLRRTLRGPVTNIFIVERSGVLVGMLDVSDLLRAGPRVPLRSLMRTPVEALPAWTPLAAARAHRAWDVSHVMPIVDDAGRLVGALRYETLRRLEREAEARGERPRTAETVVALGELFHLGLAGFIEAVGATAASRGDRVVRTGARAQSGMPASAADGER